MEYVNFGAGIKNEGNNIRQILCCECGIKIEPNSANMCVTCIRNHVDITENIPKSAVLQFCRNCERYLQPPDDWVQCGLESRELLAICVKRLKGLKDVKLVDAGFIWTDPNSKRIKVKLTVNAEVLSGTTLQQVFIVEYTVTNHMCNDCHRSEAKDFWKYLVQVRQRSENKKTLYYLEQLILKRKAHDNTLGIKSQHGGIDFFYASEVHARKMVEFLSNALPVKVTNSKRLISHDIKSNIHNCKHTISVEIPPLSKDSLVCLDKTQQRQFGGISPLCLIHRVAKTIHLIDPLTAQIAEVSGINYNRSPFEAICNPNRLTEYTVMDIEIIFDKDRKFFPGQGTISNKHVLCDIWLVKSSELGINDNTIHTKTHLGHLLKVGDNVFGYNLEDANINNDKFEKLNKDQIPDVILVKKSYGDRERRNKSRNWKLKHISNEEDKRKHDYEEFLEDLEEDADMRQNVNIYKDRKQIPIDEFDHPSDNIPRITLAEMLDDLNLDDDEMGDDI
ncbi:60S ribosomal export protein NMD3 [Condylostylus longicornis]|uniref:60S ribosomal export protein NMD3 n=1 Tax=Condylostylus longicornis TaxID=2530218 RepID=UPI00244E15DA|nr:60S ribosomal export protein NMD3 [Condylostylus longicornis]